MMVSVELEEYDLRREGLPPVALRVRARVEVDGGHAVAGGEEDVRVQCEGCGQHVVLEKDEWELCMEAVRAQAEVEAEAIAAASREP